MQKAKEARTVGILVGTLGAGETQEDYIYIDLQRESFNDQLAP